MSPLLFALPRLIPSLPIPFRSFSIATPSRSLLPRSLRAWATAQSRRTSLPSLSISGTFYGLVHLSFESAELLLTSFALFTGLASSPLVSDSSLIVLDDEVSTACLQFVFHQVSDLTPSPFLDRYLQPWLHGRRSRRLYHLDYFAFGASSSLFAVTSLSFFPSLGSADLRFRSSFLAPFLLSSSISLLTPSVCICMCGKRV
jgi:hypothetical protein